MNLRDSQNNPQFPPQDSAQQNQYQQPPQDYGQSQPAYSAQPAPGPTPEYKSVTKKVVLWFLSPVIAFAIAFTFAILGRVTSGDIAGRILNILTILAGMAGVLLIFMGPIVAIVLLIKHNK